MRGASPLRTPHVNILLFFIVAQNVEIVNDLWRIYEQKPCINPALSVRCVVQNDEITEAYQKSAVFSARITDFPLTNAGDYAKINITISMPERFPYI